MKFKPLNLHCEIEPIKQDSFIASQDQMFEEKGKVMSIADGVTKVKVNEIAYFDSWLCARFIDSEGKTRYLIPEENIRAVETDEA
jgi:hypothetical protein